jgi:hypothetical protein
MAVKPSQDYLSYLLRLWRSGKGKEAVWRASLESPLTGERLGFANLKDLFTFVETLASDATNHEADAEKGPANDSENAGEKARTPFPPM